jgi:ubiquinone biosynthesis protein
MMEDIKKTELESENVNITEEPEDVVIEEQETGTSDEVEDVVTEEPETGTSDVIENVVTEEPETGTSDETENAVTEEPETETPEISGRERRNGLKKLDEKLKNLKHSRAEMNAKMKELLASDIKEMQKRQKGRSAEILGVFAKHNFYATGLTPEELRLTLEDLGPTYVKIGQIMSSRVDLLPESYCKELEKLRQNVKELDPVLARAVIEQETGKKIEEIYKEFRDKPLGSASIGQAHYAVLLDGTPVVTKVQRPLIADMMRQDFILLKKIASIFNVVMEGADNAEDQLDLLSVIEEFEKVTEEELDCRVEAANTKFFMENCIEDETKVTCPTVYDDLTTERIFTMSFVDGYSISKKDRVIEDGYSVEEIGTNIINNYVHQILDVGVFHADPHQGNIMITHGIPCWIDFGMLGRITEGDINIIQSIVLALLEGDVETIANAIMSMGAASPKTNRDRLIEDIDVFLDRYMTVTSISDLDVSVLFEEICALAEKHHITMPGKFTMLVRSLTTIEGVIEQFCPELNLFELLSNKMMERAKKSFDLEQEIINTGKEMLEIGKKTAKIPVLASDLLKSAARGRMKMNMELTGYEELLVKGADMVRNIVLAFFACVLFIGSCFLCSADLTPKAPGGVPVLAAIGLVFSVSLAIFAVKNISQGK